MPPAPRTESVRKRPTGVPWGSGGASVPVCAMTPSGVASEPIVSSIVVDPGASRILLSG
jgi:hypothetical protein